MVVKSKNAKRWFWNQHPQISKNQYWISFSKDNEGCCYIFLSS